jgi:protein-L-isoaspartate O-methyltransferase
VGVELHTEPPGSVLITKTCAAPYRAIHVGAASPTLPQTLIDQLSSPGRMFIPVGTDRQSIWVVNKDVDGKVTKDKVMDVRVSNGLSVLLSNREAVADGAEEK